MKQGIALSVFSSFLFALLYYYATVLQPLTGEAIFAWRVVLGLPALALLITRARGWGEILLVASRLRHDVKLWLLLTLSAALIGVQLLIFVWAPLHQRGLDVSLGYFLLPLVMVVVGRVFYKERLTRMQVVAVSIAAVGVVHELWRADSFSWVTALVMFGYPPYFMLRRKMRIGSFCTLWFDMLFILPVALLVLHAQPMSVLEQFMRHPALFGMVPLLGLISSAALVAYISASRMLPLGLFGILGYVEPVLLFWVAFLFLGESMEMQAWLTYIPIWIGVLLMVAEGLLKWLQERTS
ncbi:EamA family transporter RarD [Alcaligenaceae bacterium]|nr:EamA family transporter RarD [Alcaligenaceae bacterium]